jgi:hypothetical protein
MPNNSEMIVKRFYFTINAGITGSDPVRIDEDTHARITRDIMTILAVYNTPHFETHLMLDEMPAHRGAIVIEAIEKPAVEKAVAAEVAIEKSAVEKAVAAEVACSAANECVHDHYSESDCSTTDRAESICSTDKSEIADFEIISKDAVHEINEEIPLSPISLRKEFKSVVATMVEKDTLENSDAEAEQANSSEEEVTPVAEEIPKPVFHNKLKMKTPITLKKAAARELVKCGLVNNKDELDAVDAACKAYMDDVEKGVFKKPFPPKKHSSKGARAWNALNNWQNGETQEKPKQRKFT